MINIWAKTRRVLEIEKESYKWCEYLVWVFLKWKKSVEKRKEGYIRFRIEEGMIWFYIELYIFVLYLYINVKMTSKREIKFSESWAGCSTSGA